jgi:UDP-glucuronate decarboxylase
VIEMTGSTSSIDRLPLPSDDPRQRQPDIRRARELLHWEPKIALRDGLVKTIAFFDDLMRRGLAE